jgi:hypothetical protein
MAWCLSFLKDERKLLKELRSNALRCYPEDGCFSLPWMGDMLRDIDRLWYDGRLLSSVRACYGGLILEIDEDDISVAAYVMESDYGDKLFMRFNRHLFHSLKFPEDRDDEGYHTGGLLCMDRLECLINIVLHESVHILLTVCDKQGHREDTDVHNEEFQKICRNLFGQTDPQHGLVHGMLHNMPLDEIKERLTPGRAVLVYRDEEWHAGRVVRVTGNTRVMVKCSRHDGKRKRQTTYSVHPGLVRICEDCD